MNLPEGRTARPCPRCGPGPEFLTPEKAASLAAEMPLPARLRAAEPVVKRRLACCALCTALKEEVLCAYCGCFVVFRARPLAGFCPHPEGNKWLDIEPFPKLG